MPFSYEEEMIFLFEGALRSIPFNTILALLLTLDLLHNKAPPQLMIWILFIILNSIIRWIFCHYVIRKHVYMTPKMLAIFVLLTFFMGAIWGSCYLLMLHHISILQEFIIILVLGGMSAGAIASLSVYLPAYYAYVLPMFLPVITYNYLTFELDRAMLATMFLLFVLMLVTSARINNLLLNRVFRLSREKQVLIDDLHQLSITDSLTGLYNRRYFESILKTEWGVAQRNHYPFILISIDVDNFKLINDNLGHPYGDHFLIFISELLKSSFRRSNDFICRIGGDEFSVILVNQSLQESLAICDLFNNKFHQNKPQEEAIMEQITLSMGVAWIKSNYSLQIEKLITCADEALYQAKNKGKNQVEVIALD
ncbi:regulatory protein (GGDEF domain) [Legionella sainthelensi]|uniref:diguanylate cyclase n=2 Tax=Legionella sainthelensi TaxID=28087 RepID=A0A0W0YBD5_9GAMM|nr:regulatory protein (GGDEF domain) [Legionella sainthelensi]